MIALARHLRFPIAVSLCVAVTGCTSMDFDPAVMASLPGDILAMPGTIHDLGSRPTSAHDVMRKIDRTLILIATVKKYADLTAGQKQRVEQVVTRKYDGMVAREKRSLAPKYASRKAEVQKRGAARVAEARQQSPSAAARVEADTKKEVAQVDLEWEKAAKSSVAKNYGTDFAVPVSNPEGKPVVAFASVKDGGVSVSNSAYEVDSATTSLKSSQKISHSGRTYAVLDEKISQ